MTQPELSDAQLSANPRDWRCEDCGGQEHVAGWPRRCLQCLRSRSPGEWPAGTPAPPAPRLDELGEQLELAMQRVDAAAEPLLRRYRSK